MKKKHPSKPRCIVANCVNRVFRLFGYVLLPVGEINRIEQDGIVDSNAAKRQVNMSWDHGYFVGLSDYSSKKGKQLRDRYLS